MIKKFENIPVIAGWKKLIFVTLMAGLWMSAPAMLDLNISSASNAVPSSLVATLAPITAPGPGTIGPRGNAYYGPTNTANTNILRLDVSNIPGTAPTVSVFLNSANIGTITLDSARRGTLLLGQNGGNVPVVVAGDVISVRNESTTIISGIFTVPTTPTPTPSPTDTPPPPSPSPTPPSVLRFWAELNGPAIGGITPRGNARYDQFSSTQRNLQVNVSFVNLPNGTVLSVLIGSPTSLPNTTIGTFVIQNRSGFFGSSASGNGGTLPAISPGSVIAIRNGNSTVLSGTFGTTPPTPTPTPTPNGTPSPSPTPNGTPQPVSVFRANLNGASVVPPVTTPARGMGTVVLNPAGTQITARLNISRLSSAATAVTINGPAIAGENGPVIFSMLGGTSPTSNAGLYRIFNVNAEQANQLRTGLWYFNVSTVNHPNGEIRGQIRSANSLADFTGDGAADVSVVRSVDSAIPNAANHWYVLDSTTGAVSMHTIGEPGDINVQGDYDGDSITDIAMFSPSTGNWQIRYSDTGQVANLRFGTAGDIPVVGDYDGDSINDVAVFRPSSGTWYVLQSTDGSAMIARWGMSGDRPVSGDYDGDGRSDLAVFRPSAGAWYVFRSSDGSLLAGNWGLPTDLPVSGDFDGDGSSDLAVYRPSEGVWYIYRTSDGNAGIVRFGLLTDKPVPVDYDGDGTTDIAVFRPSSGTWYIYRSTNSSVGVYNFGLETDRPVPLAYAP